LAASSSLKPTWASSGIGVGGPGNDVAVLLGRQAEQDLLHHQAGMIARDMGELQAAGDVADGIDTLVA
jgi:hypothetical protein